MQAGRLAGNTRRTAMAANGGAGMQARQGREVGMQANKSGSRGRQERVGRKDRVGQTTRAGGWASQMDSRLSGKAAGRQTN